MVHQVCLLWPAKAQYIYILRLCNQISSDEIQNRIERQCLDDISLSLAKNLTASTRNYCANFFILVFSCLFHKTTLEKVAIKIISRAYLQTSEILANATKREMAILKLIRHPNIVRYIEAVDEPNIPYVYIIMEYVEGCELFNYLLESRRLMEAEARSLFWQVCVAVDWCHQRNIWY